MTIKRKDVLAAMRDVLTHRHEAFQKVLNGHLGSLEHQSGGDVADIATNAHQTAFASQLAEAENKELAQIEHALGKIKTGLFGVCEACDKDIPVARLRALTCSN